MNNQLRQSNVGQSTLFTSCCLQHPCGVRRVQYVRVCPRFPLPDSSPPGRLSWDGDRQKREEEEKKKKKGRREGGNRSRRCWCFPSFLNQRCWDQHKDVCLRRCPPRRRDCDELPLQTAAKVKGLPMRREERQHLQQGGKTKKKRRRRRRRRRARASTTI